MPQNSTLPKRQIPANPPCSRIIRGFPLCLSNFLEEFSLVSASAPSSAASPGRRFRQALEAEKPLLIPGAINAYCARMAERSGFRALYLSGGGVAAAMGMPDLAVTTVDDVALDAGRITAVTDLPLLVDADTGFGSWLNIRRMVRSFIRHGVAGIHLEDQAAAKRCGHRPNKQLVSPEEMSDRLAAACDARTDPDFFIMARTDTLAAEPLQQVIDRLAVYVDAGADMIFLEAARSLDDYRAVKEAFKVPLLANITEFGQTPLFTADELATAEVDIMLFPLSAFRAMNRAALSVYQTIRRAGSQKEAVETMQTREELYDFLDYHRVEEEMNQLFDKKKGATG